jgi:hypothetical protein
MDTRFEIRVRTEELEVWKRKARAADLTLSAWIRAQCSQEWTPKEIMQATAVNESNQKYYHTATSNRLTCLCESCSAYRANNDIPLGGFKHAGS